MPEKDTQKKQEVRPSDEDVELSKEELDEVAGGTGLSQTHLINQVAKYISVSKALNIRAMCW